MKFTKITLVAILGFALMPIAAHAEEGKPGVPNAPVNTEADVEILAGEDPVEPEKPIGPPTGQEGPLTIDAVASFHFGATKLGVKNLEAIVPENEILGVQVSDKRGTGLGWNLTAQISEFENQDKTKQLRGAKINLPAGKVESSKGNPLFPAIASKTTLSSTPQTILLAEKDNGMGTWTEDFNGNTEKVQLSVPSDAYVDNYQATITWALQDAPK